MCGALLFSSNGARAEALFDLRWDAPPGCPGAESVRARVEHLVGAPSGTKLERDLTVRGTVAESRIGADLVLVLIDGGVRGERTLSGATCEEVTSAGALVIALAIDPTAAERVPAESGAPEPEPNAGPADPEEPVARFEPPSSASAEGAAPPEPVPAPATAREPMAAPTPGAPGTKIAGGAWVAAMIDAGTLPGAGGGVGVGGGAWIDDVRLLAEAFWLPARQGTAEDFPEKGGTIALVAGALSACWAPAAVPLTLGLCLTGEAGAMPFSGQNLETPRSEAEPWLSTGLSGALWWSPAGTPLLVSARAGGVLPLARPTFVFVAENGDEVTAHRPSPLSFRGIVGAGVEFR